MDFLSDEIESVLFVGREALVYKVPPRTTNEGYKAASWNDQGLLWKGRLRVLEIGDRCEIRLEDSGTGELFATTKYTPPYTSVEPVLDSSRYFVLRVEGEGGRKAYIGMGFEERGDAFDFNVALQSFTKRINSQSSSGTDQSTIPTQPPRDYSLKDGQTFSIKIPGRDGRKVGGLGTASGGGAGGAGAGAGAGAFVSGQGDGIPMLAPPPPAASSRKR